MVRNSTSGDVVKPRQAAQYTTGERETWSTARARCAGEASRYQARHIYCSDTYSAREQIHSDVFRRLLTLVIAVITPL